MRIDIDRKTRRRQEVVQCIVAPAEVGSAAVGKVEVRILLRTSSTVVCCGLRR